MVDALTDEIALGLVTAAAAHAARLALKPLCIVVLSTDLTVRAAISQSGASALRFDVARGKASGALQMGMDSRMLEQLAGNRPAFFASLTTLARGAMVPAAGGVLLRDGLGDVVGAIGISGDGSDNDEACAFAAIEQSDRLAR